MKKENEKNYRITIGQLIDHLKGFDKNAEVIFGGDDLTFYRTKQRSENLVQIEFNQTVTDGKIIKHD